MIRTRIIATIGPAVGSREKIAALIDAGVNVFRLNMSHGDAATRGQWLEWIREIATAKDKPVGVLADLAGPKIRTGLFATGSATLAPGAAFTITTRDIVGNGNEVSTTYKALPSDVKTGDRILLDDGNIELEVTGTTETDVMTKVIDGGVLRDRKGINLPGVNVSSPALSDKDCDDLAWCIEHDIDFIAVSFVRQPEDVAMVKRIVADFGRQIPVIAKIEKPEAVRYLDEIIEISNGVMVARGDLGIEVGPQKVPLIQKRIIETANRKGVTVITATQMLESMISNSRPTRAEASDVANAIFDGTDAVMLSGETAMGQYPIETVKMMVSIIEDAETRVLTDPMTATGSIESDLPFTSILARAACHTAEEVQARYLAVFSESGRSVRLVSKYKPNIEILGLTDKPAAWRRMSLCWGVLPKLAKKTWHSDRMLHETDLLLQETGVVKRGDVLVILFGTETGVSGSINSMRLLRVGETWTGWRYRTEVRRKKEQQPLD